MAVRWRYPAGSSMAATVSHRSNTRVNASWARSSASALLPVMTDRIPEEPFLVLLEELLERDRLDHQLIRSVPRPPEASYLSHPEEFNTWRAPNL
jgi:hypothetical protein